jgi:hypothetical protein
MLMRNKLTNTHMNDIDTMASYLMKISKLRDWLLTIKEKFINEELVPIALNGNSIPWGPFVQSIYILAISFPPLGSFEMILSKRKQDEKQLQLEWRRSKI